MKSVCGRLLSLRIVIMGSHGMATRTFGPSSNRMSKEKLTTTGMTSFSMESPQSRTGPTTRRMWPSRGLQCPQALPPQTITTVGRILNEHHSPVRETRAFLAIPIVRRAPSRARTHLAVVVNGTTPSARWQVSAVSTTGKDELAMHEAKLATDNLVSGVGHAVKCSRAGHRLWRISRKRRSEAAVFWIGFFRGIATDGAMRFGISVGVLCWVLKFICSSYFLGLAGRLLQVFGSKIIIRIFTAKKTPSFLESLLLFPTIESHNNDC